MGILERLSYRLHCLVTEVICVDNIINISNVDWVTKIKLIMINENLIRARFDSNIMNEKMQGGIRLDEEKSSWFKISEQVIQIMKG